MGCFSAHCFQHPVSSLPSVSLFAWHFETSSCLQRINFHFLSNCGRDVFQFGMPGCPRAWSWVSKCVWLSFSEKPDFCPHPSPSQVPRLLIAEFFLVLKSVSAFLSSGLPLLGPEFSFSGLLSQLSTFHPFSIFQNLADIWTPLLSTCQQTLPCRIYLCVLSPLLSFWWGLGKEQKLVCILDMFDMLTLTISLNFSIFAFIILFS